MNRIKQILQLSQSNSTRQDHRTANQVRALRLQNLGFVSFLFKSKNSTDGLYGLCDVWDRGRGGSRGSRGPCGVTGPRVACGPRAANFAPRPRSTLALGHGIDGFRLEAFFWVKNRNLQNTMSENVFKIFKTEMSENVLLQRFNESSKMNAYYEEITVIKTKTFRRKILIYGYLDM